MKSAENNCGERRNGSALRPHISHKKPVSSNQDTGLRAAGETDAPAGISLYGFCKEDTGYGIGTQFFKFAFYERKAHAGSQNIVD